jgi:hypothetical protein
MIEEFHQVDVEAYGEGTARRILATLIAVIVQKHWALPDEEVGAIVAGIEHIRQELAGKVNPN